MHNVCSSGKYSTEEPNIGERTWESILKHSMKKMKQIPFFSPKVGDKIIFCGCSDFLPSGYYDLRPYCE